LRTDVQNAPACVLTPHQKIASERTPLRTFPSRRYSSNRARSPPRRQREPQFVELLRGLQPGQLVLAGVARERRLRCAMFSQLQSRPGTTAGGERRLPGAARNETRKALARFPRLHPSWPLISRWRSGPTRRHASSTPAHVRVGWNQRQTAKALPEPVLGKGCFVLADMSQRPMKPPSWPPGLLRDNTWVSRQLGQDDVQRFASAPSAQKKRPRSANRGYAATVALGERGRIAISQPFLGLASSLGAFLLPTVPGYPPALAFLNPALATLLQATGGTQWYRRVSHRRRALAVL
jgi:hypothetical protein